MEKRIITSYKEPDLDGVSSMYAYAEYLNKHGIQSDYYIKGKPKKEVGIVCNLFGIELGGCKEITEEQEIVLVDTNTIEVIPFNKPEKIVEIIDHHSMNESTKQCINARIQIERLGAAATLIAEKFKENNIPISRESAILLYYGIISNSINLKASITTQKDIDMANWLEKQCNEIKKEKIIEIFTLKSQIIDTELRKCMEAEMVFDYNGKKITIAQLEVVNIEEFLKENEDKIVEILKQIKTEKNIEYIFINCVDILKGFNIILTIDDITRQFLKEIIGYEFEDSKCKFDKIIQRKDIFKLIIESMNNEAKSS